MELWENTVSGTMPSAGGLTSETKKRGAPEGAPAWVLEEDSASGGQTPEQ